MARLRVSGELPPGMIFAPIHWSDVFCSDARVGAAIHSAVDPISGEPEFKYTPANVTPFEVDWHGFVLSRNLLDLSKLTWRARTRGEQSWHYELAGRGAQDWSHWARQLLAVGDETVDLIEYLDKSSGEYRAAHLVDDRLETCLFISPRIDLPSREWLSSLFPRRRVNDRDRPGLLVGQPPNHGADAGSTICSCFGVGRNTICRHPSARAHRGQAGRQASARRDQLRFLSARDRDLDRPAASRANVSAYWR